VCREASYKLSASYKIQKYFIDGIPVKSGMYPSEMFPPPGYCPAERLCEQTGAFDPQVRFEEVH